MEEMKKGEVARISDIINMLETIKYVAGDLHVYGHSFSYNNTPYSKSKLPIYIDFNEHALVIGAVGKTEILGGES